VPIFAVSAQKCAIVNSVNSGVSRPNVTNIVHSVEKFILVVDDQKGAGGSPRTSRQINSVTCFSSTTVKN